MRAAHPTAASGRSRVALQRAALTMSDVALTYLGNLMADRLLLWRNLAPEDCNFQNGRSLMSLGTILVIILILLLIGALPSWPYSTGWGYYPSGGLGLVLVIIIILLLLGRI